MSYLNFIKIVIVLSAACTFNNVQAGLPDQENKTYTSNYRNVDVEIKYDRDGIDYFEKVDVFGKNRDEKPQLVIWHKDRGYCEILILHGVRVNIYDHNSGRLLEIYTSRETRD